MEFWAMHKRILAFLSLVLLITSITTCYNNSSPSSSEHALLIKKAINSNNVKALRSLTDLPLFFRNQEWESASDGYGFVLGSFKQIQLSSDAEFTKHFNKFIKTIQIEGNKVITQDISLDLFSEELRGQTKNWRTLKLHLLKRGEGDVEHIVLLGLDKNTNKLKAIYIN